VKGNVEMTPIVIEELSMVCKWVVKIKLFATINGRGV
jgi:hypothetical protein